MPEIPALYPWFYILHLIEYFLNYCLNEFGTFGYMFSGWLSNPPFAYGNISKSVCYTLC